jgi:Nucleotidyl transferase AbiEii toxin, Type IV TA system
MEPRHERIARIALAAGARYGLALAGGYAISAHGIGNRSSGDVDLFTSWQHRDEFPNLMAAVVSALQTSGYKATTIMSAETFARLTLTDLSDGTEEKLELPVDWRAHDPVQLDTGPVLHADDAVANKVCALFGRALPRDFPDVDAALTSGRYTREQLLELAANAELVVSEALANAARHAHASAVLPGPPCPTGGWPA